MKTIIREMRIRSASGSTQRKVWSDGTFHCACEGFSFRGRCRHVEVIKQIVA